MQLYQITKTRLDQLKSDINQLQHLDSYRYNNEPINFSSQDLEPIGVNFSHNHIPSLNAMQGSKPDIDNVLAIYRFINQTAAIKHYQTVYEGLWVYLTHKIFPTYTRKRYKPNDDNFKFANQIRRYWFIGERQHSNAVFSLYLIAKLTWSPWQEDPDYFQSIAHQADDHYTRLLCSLPDYKMLFSAPHGSFTPNADRYLGMSQPVGNSTGYNQPNEAPVW